MESDRRLSLSIYRWQGVNVLCKRKYKAGFFLQILHTESSLVGAYSIDNAIFLLQLKRSSLKEGGLNDLYYPA